MFEGIQAGTNSFSSQALELLLVQRFDENGLSGWSPVETIFEDQFMAAGSGSYNWTVPDVKEHDV
jgi:hypothetical protein